MSTNIYKDPTIVKSIETSSRSFADWVGKIKIPKDFTTILERAQGRIRIEFAPELNNAPSIVVVDNEGKFLASYDQVVALSGHRRFLNEAIKKADAERASVDKIELVSKLMIMADDEKLSVPECIVKGNVAQLSILKSELEVVTKNIKALEGINDDVGLKDHVLDCSKRYESVLIKLLMGVVGNTKVTDDKKKEAVAASLVPTWLITKFKNSDVFKDIEDLSDFLYPRNFMKSFGLNMKEIENNQFLRYNVKLIEGNWPFLAAVKKFLLMENLFQDIEAKDARTKFEERRDTYIFVLDTKKPLSTILEDKIANRGLTTMVKYMSQGNFTENRKIIDNMTIINAFNFNWNAAMRLQIDVTDPCDQFWSAGFDTSGWEITPDHNIFKCIQDDVNHLQILDGIRRLDKTWVRHVIYFVKHKVGYYVGDNADKLEVELEKLFIEEVFENNKLKDTIFKTPGIVLDTSTEQELVPLVTLPPKGADQKKVRKFLKLEKPRDGKVKRNQAIRGKVDHDFTVEMNRIEVHYRGDEVMMTKVRDWLQSTFAANNKFRNLAAEFIANALDEGIDEPYQEVGDQGEDD